MMVWKQFFAIVAFVLLALPAAAFATTEPNLECMNTYDVFGILTTASTDTLSTGNYVVNLINVYTVSSTSSDQVAVVSISELSADNLVFKSQAFVLKPYSSTTYLSSTGEKVKIGVCAVMSGNPSWAGVGASILPPSPNKAPVITSIGGPTSLSAGTDGTWSVSAYDPDGSYLSYSTNWGDGLDQQQAGHYASPSTATFQHTYSHAGTYTIKFTVTDSQGASTESTITVAVGSGVSPSCDGYADLSVGKTINTGTYSVKLADVDTDGSGSAIIEISDYTGALRAEEKIAPGTRYVFGTGSAIAVEVCKSSSTSSVKIKAYSTALPATLLCSGYTTRHKGETLDRGEYKATLADVMFESGTSTQRDVASFDIYDSAGRFIVTEAFFEGSTFTFSENGSAKTVNMKVCQIARGANGVSWAKLAMSVESTKNMAPVIKEVTGSASLSVNQAGTWKVSAYDPDGNAVYYGVNWGEGEYATLDTASKTGSSATFEHTYSRAGTYTITFTVKDAQGSETQSSTTVTVSSSVSPSCDGYTILRVGQDIGHLAGEQFYARLSDVSASVSTYPAIISVLDAKYNVLGNIQVDPGQTYIYYTPNGAVLKISVCETNPNPGTGLSSKWAKVKVSSDSILPSNLPPVISDVAGSASLSVNQAGAWKVSAHDPDGTSLTYSVVWGDEGTKEGAFAKETGNSASFGHTYSKAGVYTITFTVTDSAGATATKSANVSVIGVAPSQKITLKLAPGWNQISVPTMDLEVSDLAKKCDISQTVWYYNAASKQYAKATSLGGGHVGYWVKANSACEYTLDSTYVTPAPGAFNLKAGWNMIGSPLKATAVADFAGNCKITSGAWHYSQVATSGQATNGEYVYASKLEPGEGYWVKVASDCTLGGDAPPSAPSG